MRTYCEGARPIDDRKRPGLDRSPERRVIALLITSVLIDESSVLSETTLASGGNYIHLSQRPVTERKSNVLFQLWKT